MVVFFMGIENDALANKLADQLSHSAATNENQSNGLITDLLGGMGHAYKSQYDGLRQACGASVDLSYNQNENSLQKVGHAIGDASLFIAAAALMKEMPVVSDVAEGKLATVAAGGLLGLTAPVQEGQGLTTRLEHAGLGAGTMAIMEFGPKALGGLSVVKALPEKSLASSFTPYGLANGLAGLGNVESQSLLNTGHNASLRDLAIGGGTWALMGTAARQLGTSVESWKSAGAEAKAAYAPENAPWQFKNITDIKATDLQPGQTLEPGNYRLSFISQGAERKANIYVSQGAADASVPAPVVTHLHGLNPNGRAEEILSELNYFKLADQDGAVVAMLQGRDGLKALGTYQSFHDVNFGYAKPAEGAAPYSDQVAFGDMMSLIRDHVPNANTDNIAVSGFSLGGKMANRIAATRADVGVVASIHGTMDHLDADIMNSALNRHPIDGIFVLSTNDKVLPIGGGKSLFTVGLENNHLSQPRSQAEFWGASNAGAADSNLAQPLTTDSANYVRRDWRAADGEHRVTEYTVKGGAHAIDGAPPRSNIIQMLMGAPKPANYFDARQRTWDFMLKSLRGQQGAAVAETGDLTAAS